MLRVDPRRTEADELLQELTAEVHGPDLQNNKTKKPNETTTAYADPLYGKFASAHESGALDVINRLLDDRDLKRVKRASKKSLSTSNLHTILMDAFRILQEVIADLHEARSLQAVSQALVGNGRSAYLGVLLVMVSLLALVFVP